MGDRDTASRKVASSSDHVSKDRQLESLFDSGYSTGTISLTNINTDSRSSISSSCNIPSSSTASSSSSSSSPFKTCHKTGDSKVTSTKIPPVAATDSGLCIDSDLDLTSSVTIDSIDQEEEEQDQQIKSCNTQLKQQQQQQYISCNSIAAFTPDQEGDTLLHLAIVKGETSWALKIIQLTPHPDLLDMKNSSHQTALHLASLTRQSELVRRLMLAGATLDICDKVGNTALHVACEEGNLDVVKSILEPLSSVELNSTRQAFYKPLIQRTDLLELIHQMNHEGLTCVHLATKSGKKKILEYLKVYGADLNIREGKSGWTPLHMAVSSTRDDLVQCLLTFCRVDVNAANYAGCTPLKLAARLENWFRSNSSNNSSKLIQLQVQSLCKIMMHLLEAGALMNDGHRQHCVHSDTEDEDEGDEYDDDDEDDDDEDQIEHDVDHQGEQQTSDISNHYFDITTGVKDTHLIQEQIDNQ